MRTALYLPLLTLFVLCVALSACQAPPDHLQSASNGILQAPSIAPPSPVAPPTLQNRAQPPQQRLFTPPPSYSAVPRSWIPSGPPRPWRWIVIHHSDTDNGSAASFDRYHRQVHHWDSLGYDFVIGNGNGAPDGLVEVGPRWTRQQVGAHAGVLEFNEQGIGICLVGNFQSDRPTFSQLQSLARLNAFLMRRYGIRADHIISHREAKKGKTNCPGRYLSIATVRTMSQQLAQMDNWDTPYYLPIASSDALADLFAAKQ